MDRKKVLIETLNKDRAEVVRLLKDRKHSGNLIVNPKKNKLSDSRWKRVGLVTVIGAVVGAVLYTLYKKNEFNDVVTDIIKRRQENGEGTGGSVITESLNVFSGDEGMNAGINTLASSGIVGAMVGGVVGFTGAGAYEIGKVVNDSITDITYSDVKDFDVDVIEAQFSKYRIYVINKYRELSKADLPHFDELEEAIKKLSSKPQLFTNL